MAFSCSLLSSMPMVAPGAKVAPSSMAAPVARVATVSKAAPVASRLAPIARSRVKPAVARVAPPSNVATTTKTGSDLILPLGRSDFPEDFVFGSSTAAYQIEGGINSRGPSAWDAFSHNYPEKIKDRSNGDVACDSYNLYPKDIELMTDLGLDAYRLSISWSRILPTGKIKDGVNAEGVKYYKDLIKALKSKGITPYVTLFHVDRPQSLEEEYGGFLSPYIVDDFRDFVDVCFKEFGDDVDHWTTLNEPYVLAIYGYGQGMMAPGRCSDWQDLNCLGGDSAKEPYIVGKNLLLAHLAAVELYRSTYQTPNGRIGITLDSSWLVPFSDIEENKQAAIRGMDFHLGWFLQPITKGDYPESMKKLVGDRLPAFSDDQIQRLKNTYDFIGLNYYSSQYAADNPVINTPPSAITDPHVEFTDFRHGVAIGEYTDTGMYVYPQGLRNLLRYVKENYNNPAIYITENGMGDIIDPSLPIDEAIMDISRIDYYYRHLYYVKSAINDYNVNVQGYFAWSLLDNYEWANGYAVRFGLNYTDYKTLERIPKYSAKWFKQFLSS